MGSVTSVVSYNLARLTKFSGRDRSATFWPYVGVLFVLVAAAWAAVFYLRSLVPWRG